MAKSSKDKFIASRNSKEANAKNEKVGKVDANKYKSGKPPMKGGKKC